MLSLGSTLGISYGWVRLLAGWPIHRKMLSDSSRPDIISLWSSQQAGISSYHCLRTYILPFQGCVSNSPCTAVRWVPSSSTLFLVSHADGTIIVYDRERDDGTFKPSEEAAKEWDPVDNIFVSMPPWHPVSGAALKTEKEKAVKNPVSHWRVSRKSIVDFVFSPDVKYVAAISEDGCLRVIDALAEQLVDCYASYFGALSCIAWSPDGRFILVGTASLSLKPYSPFLDWWPR